METLVIIPTYNEKENIGLLLPEVFDSLEGAHVLVVDDNSPDGTRLLVEQMQVDRYPGRLHLLSRPAKAGLGTAYVAGFRWALARSYQYVAQMDADFSHNPKYLPDLLRLAHEYDVVIGSRYIPGGGARGWGAIRQFVSRGGNVYARAVLGVPYQDMTGGFKCFRRNVLQSIDLDAVHSKGYAFQIETTYRALRRGFTVAETPIIFEDRVRGRSQFSIAILLEAMTVVWRLRRQARG